MSSFVMIANCRLSSTSRGPRRNYPCIFGNFRFKSFWRSGGRIFHFSIFRCRP